ncbi:tartrate dehydrogenase [Rhodococcus koreensis]|uniref:tartrate dehydrogenase n=1 Tax=Rhodococcus koreensis TaxID=99653 RepID=UPI001F12813D|nr:tartrate dehydrogenase [Rhodococcus koreensis]
MTTLHQIAVIPGDGIGREVIEPAMEVLEQAARQWDFSLAWTTYPWSCAYYTEHGHMMPGDGLDRLAESDAIFLGAVGDPSVADDVSLWGLLIPIRRAFDQYVNLRPLRLLRGIDSPLESLGGAVDLLVVRENSEGEYSEAGGRLFAGTSMETAIQESVFTRRGIERIMRYAFDRAEERTGRLVSATKSNGIIHTMPLWDQICGEIGSERPRITVDSYHIDALAAYFVQRPETLDVVVASNLFGDILSDLGAAIVGGIGLAPSANVNPDRTYPSMFEPVHGSAPDIANLGVANPIGQIWTGALMLEHLGHPEAGAAVVAALEDVLADSDIRTQDLGGSASTAEFTRAVLDALRSKRPAFVNHADEAGPFA